MNPRRDRSVREVSVSQLRERLAEVLTDVVGGRRVVISRHGCPLAVLISLDDAIDSVVAVSEHFEGARREVAAELERGSTKAFDPRPRPFGFVIGRRAAAEWAALNAPRRGRLSDRLLDLARRRPASGLVTVRALMHAAACVISAERELIAVYAVRTRRALLARVFGPDLDRAISRRFDRRAAHGRTSEVQRSGSSAAGRAGDRVGSPAEETEEEDRNGSPHPELNRVARGLSRDR